MLGLKLTDVNNRDPRSKVYYALDTDVGYGIIIRDWLYA